MDFKIKSPDQRASEGLALAVLAVIAFISVIFFTSLSYGWKEGIGFVLFLCFVGGMGKWDDNTLQD